MDQFTRFPSDIEHYSEDVYYEFREYISKNNQHRFKDVHASNKTVRAYAVVDSPKCLVKILDSYIAKLPPDPRAFYLRQLVKCPQDPSKPWYINVPVGINTIKTFLPDMSCEAELSTRYTNHSLRATSASSLFSKNVPEKIIQRKLVIAH